MDATFPFHMELVLQDQKLYLSGNGAPQFLRHPFLADNIYSFTTFPNNKPGALPCLQTLSHWANFLLILFLSHSQLSAATGRCLLNWNKRLGPRFPHYAFSPSLSLMSSLIIVYTGKWESVWLAPLNQRRHCARTSAVKDDSNRGRTKEKGRGCIGKRDLSRETSRLGC